MRRREFITLVGMTAASWSFAARAQQPETVAKIGFVYPGPEPIAKLRIVPFLAGLASEGLRQPEDFVLITRATGGDMAKVPSILDELLASKVDLLVISGPPLTRAVHDSIKTLPIVTFDLESDPVESGWLQSYARPGGNLTGVFSDFSGFQQQVASTSKGDRSGDHQACGSLGPVDATSAAGGGCSGRAVGQHQNRSS